MSSVADGTAAFWELAGELIVSQDDVEEGTLMGSRCLRAGGEFLATVHRGSGELVVKLDAGRVAELIEEGTGVPFAPAGRTFREWIAVPDGDLRLWRQLLEEALRLNRGRRPS